MIEIQRKVFNRNKTLYKKFCVKMIPSCEIESKHGKT